ncbi:uncharacterized protein B0I36DRAFT_383825 [Microdochium trichocladiopsis]|uniref:Ring-like domain-containing protein n=1 Tax=Microdochium trichocladiopsis TaxID=1682393 RepID=A0A9P8Y5W8_9PEZI|nr:uncharacterized protein B0I36DRAFT_383825 [Microdochium trichocladiopsis]KAH7030911.1 hypothetical protein B0I36DRAFT_383825 [Microdochium trichocladiopsis]
MLEYFTYKKVKKHKAEKEDRERLEQNKNDAAKPTPASTSSTTATPAASSAPTIFSKPSEQQPTSSPGRPLLDHEDEAFLERLTSSERDATAAAGTADTSDEPHARPPLPSRPHTIDLAWDSDASSVASAKHDNNVKNLKDGKTATSADGKGSNRLSFITNIPRSISVRVKNSKGDKSKTATDNGKGKGKGPKADHLAVPSDKEANREQTEVAKVLDDLNLAASGDNKVFSLSKESAEVVQRFTQVLKDLVNGVPTAYGDLVKLIEDRDKVISNNFDRLPKGLKKLVTQLPDQLTSKLAPEVLAIAAEAQGLAVNEAGDGLKGAAKNFANPKNLYDLVTKPGAIVGLLKGIVNALKARWPAFIGTNVLWSVAIFLLLSVLWYCYKRGREERIAREAGANPIDGKDRIEELPDDPLLPAPPASSSIRSGAEATATTGTSGSPTVTLSPPPLAAADAGPSVSGKSSK